MSRVLDANERQAVRLTPWGLEIFNYFIDDEDGSLRADPYGGSVILSDDAQRTLVDMILRKQTEPPIYIVRMDTPKMPGDIL